MAKLRKGKTKAILESSVDSALLAVEVYNKPRTVFRSEAFISMMIIAWTRLFHAYFNKTIGDRYYYKDKRGKFVVQDGERRTWSLIDCLRQYGSLSDAEKKNLEFFVQLRNKIEHRHIHSSEVDIHIFGECQALLMNYENLMIRLFGDSYALHESLVYSLQLSHFRTRKQTEASQIALSKDLLHIMDFVAKFRGELEDDVFNSQKYSVKLIQIPNVSNTNRADAAIQFVRWEELTDEQTDELRKAIVLIKDHRVRVPAANAGLLRPSQVIQTVNEAFGENRITQNLHVTLYKLFGIRPSRGSNCPDKTNVEYCCYNEPYGDYLYTGNWVAFLIQFLDSGGWTPEQLRELQKSGGALKLEDFPFKG